MLRAVAKQVLQMEGLGEATELSLVLVDDEGITQLNKLYLDRNEPTDVLAFPQPADDLQLGWMFLGDVIISVETVCRQAKEYGHSVEGELALVLVHGILHLLGYKHEDKRQAEIMEAKQNIVLSRFFR